MASGRFRQIEELDRYLLQSDSIPRNWLVPRRLDEVPYPFGYSNPMIAEHNSVNTEEDRTLLGVVVGTHAFNWSFDPLLEQICCSTFYEPV